MSSEVVKLQASLLKLQAQHEEAVREKDAIAKDLARVKDLNRRGDAELRKAEAIILKSREAQQVALLMDERDTYMQQVKAIQELLRQNAEELEKYKKLVSEGAGSGGAAASAGTDATKQAEMQEKINKLRADVREAEAKVVAAEAALATARAAAPAPEGEAGAAAASPSDAAVQEAQSQLDAANAALTELRTQLLAAEDEAEAGASEAVRQTRARQKLEREQKEIITTLETALEAKIREVAALQEAASNAEAAHARDLESLLARMNEKEAENLQLRTDVKAATDTIEAMKLQIEEMRRKADEEQRKAIEKAVEKARKEKGSVEESVHAELTRKLDAVQVVVKQLTEANAELQREKEAVEADAKATREKLIKREQKLTLAVQAKAEAESQLGDLQTEMAALRKRNEKFKKENKANEESLKLTRAEMERTTTELRKLTDAKRAVDEQLASTKASLASLTADHERALAELETARTDCATHADAVAKLEAAVAAAEARMEEMKSEHAISVRLIKQMNGELKAQLAAEARRVAKLEREAATAHAARSAGGSQLTRAQSMAGGAPGRSTPQSPLTTPATAPGSVGASPGRAGAPARAPPSVTLPPSAGSSAPPAGTSPLSAVSNVVSRTFRADSSFATPPGPMVRGGMPARGPPSAGVQRAPAVASVGGSDMEETVRMLGARLQSVLGEAEVAKEKVRMLETIIQDLTSELDEKKRLLKQLTASKPAGEDEAAGVQRAIQAAAASENPVAVLRSLLEKTMSENARLKRDMKIIGDELSTAQDKISQLSADAARANAEDQGGAQEEGMYYNEEDGAAADDGEHNGNETDLDERAGGEGNPFGDAADSSSPRVMRVQAAGNPF